MTSTPASAGTWSCRGTTRSDHNSWRRREGCSKITCFLTCDYNYNGLDCSRFLYMLSPYTLQPKLNRCPHSLLPESFKYVPLCPGCDTETTHFGSWSTNNSSESSNKLANICATSAMTFTCETVSPEGHGEPHSHHHVGSATVLRRENSLKITPYLKE